jgi:GNAT superfamily N-acetyltransferase
MRLLSNKDHGAIRSYLMRDPYLYLYHLADLDEPFASDVRWFALEADGDLSALALLYVRPDPPVLQLLEPENDDAFLLLEEILPHLPDRVYCHLSPGLPEILSGSHALESQNRFAKMKWTGPVPDDPVGGEGPRPLRLTAGHEAMIRRFPLAPWFDPRMLKDGYYFGVFEDGQLLSLAGTVVYSEKLGVAAVGGVGTLETHRRRGLARRTIAGLLRALEPRVPHIGLNVRTDNEAALSCYRGLGFERHGDYWECTATRTRGGGR